MAIIEGEDGIEVQIICDGQPLHEYEDADLEKIPGTATRYVVAETDRAFLIRCTFTTEVHFRGDTIACIVYLDGKQVTSVLVSKARCELKSLKYDLDGANTTLKTMCPFLFSDLSVSEFMMTCHVPSTCWLLIRP
jgi:hypothetical protein